MISMLLLDENEPSFSLAAISERYLGLGAADEKSKMDTLLAERFPQVRSARQRKAHLWRLPASEVAPYACGDVELPERLEARFAPALEQWGLTSLAEEMNAYSLLLARMQKAGIRIDAARCRALSESTAERQAALLARIRESAGPAFNPSSWQQVTRLLGTRNAREATLRPLYEREPLARLIVDYKKLGKAKAAYYDAILAGLDANGYLHPQLNLTPDQTDEGGTRSGRLSCSDPNFQALPHVDDDPNAIYQVRQLVIPRPGYRIAKLDYERAEVWMGASYCREPRLLRAYAQDEDPYVEMVARLGISRQQAKILFLMIQYGAGCWKIAEVFGWSESKARDVRQKFYDAYPMVRRAMYAYSDQWKETGVVRLWSGRVCHYIGDKPYAAWNRVIQGAVGEMIRTAMQRLEAPLAVLGARMILQVHDELVVEYPAEVERDVLALCAREMTDFPQFLLRPRVEASVGRNYGNVEKLKEAA